MTRREPRIVVKQRSRPRPVPSPDSAIRDAMVIAGLIAFLFLVYLYADLVRVAHP